MYAQTSGRLFARHAVEYSEFSCYILTFLFFSKYEACYITLIVIINLVMKNQN